VNEAVADAQVAAPAFVGWLRVGSLAARTSVEHEADRVALDSMFKQCLVPLGLAAALSRADGHLAVQRVDAWAPEDLSLRVEPDGIAVEERGATLSVATERAAASLDRSTAQWTCRVRVLDGELEHHTLRVHLSVVMHRILLALGAAYLHAAAVVIEGETHLFVGEKGAGKTTLCLALARRGGVVLSDDHVLLRRRDGQYVVSGCEQRSRVTAQTESFLFQQPLPIEPADFAGTLKKEFLVADHFRSTPFEDAPVRAMHFPHIGERLNSRRRSAMETTIDLLARTRKSYRPAGNGEVSALLDLWAGLAAAVPAYDLELTANLADLARLDAVLG